LTGGRYRTSQEIPASFNFLPTLSTNAPSAAENKNFIIVLFGLDPNGLGSGTPGKGQRSKNEDAIKVAIVDDLFECFPRIELGANDGLHNGVC
jgi:hypothetical protein